MYIRNLVGIRVFRNSIEIRVAWKHDWDTRLLGALREYEYEGHTRRIRACREPDADMCIWEIW